jgi:cation diffusion facilitator CzcD-associated flavoprotein CzcO
VNESARIYGIDKKIRFKHKVDAAKYSSAQKQWTCDVTIDGKQSATFKSRFIVLCTGYYDYHNPLKVSIPGIDNFKGPVIHPQFWPEDLDYSGKNVVVIGSGATAVTLLPAMAEKASHVTMLQRSPGYVISMPQEDGIEKVIRSCFSWAPAFQHSLFRAKWIAASMLITTLSKYLPSVTRRIVYSWMDRDLPASTPRDPHFAPSYNPWEQRMCLCPDGDFFSSLQSGRSSVITDTIQTITPDTIRLTSGKELHPDIIVTATGLQLQFAGGIALSVDGKPFAIGEKFIWKGMMIEDLPNASFSIGYVDASWTLGADASAQLFCRLLAEMQAEGSREVTPRMDDKEKSSMHVYPMLRLSSTYVKKSAHLMPKSGDRGQWVPRSYYLRDIWNAWYGDIRTSLQWS